MGIIDLIFVFLFVSWVSSLVVTVFGAFLVYRRLLNPISITINSPESISILKPVKGVDFDLSGNLESFFQLNYPKYEIIFSIASAEDPCRPVIERLIQNNPEHDAKLIIDEVSKSANPKVSNLVKSYASAKYDLLLISDSNIRVTPDYLWNALQSMGQGIGIVTTPVLGELPSGFGARLEAVQLNGICLRWIYMAHFFGHAFVLGKSMLFRRSMADRFGGIGILGKYIAEDYMAGSAMQKLGLTIGVMRVPVIQRIGTYSFRSFWLRHIRWGRIRKAQVPLFFLIEPFTCALFSGAVGAFSTAFLFHASAIDVFVLHLFIWFLCDRWMLTPRSFRPSIGTWFLRECLAIPLWVVTAFGNSVEWRGQKLRLRTGGLIV